MADDIIDRAVIAELNETMGADFAAELVDTFLQEAPVMLDQLDEAERGGDADGFRRAAHSIKSNAEIFGARALADLARRSELEGPQPGAVAGIRAAFARAETALRDLTDG